MAQHNGRRRPLRLESLPENASDRFLQAARFLTDRDASTLAPAAWLGCPLLTDDGRMRKVAAQELPGARLVSTLEILQAGLATLSPGGG